LSVAKDVIARLGEARTKLNAAQQKGFQGVVVLERTENLVNQAIGGTNSGRQLLAEIGSKKKALKDELAGIQVLVKAIEAAVEGLNNAGRGGGTTSEGQSGAA
jgi:hypothetical protein